MAKCRTAENNSSNQASLVNACWRVRKARKYTHTTSYKGQVVHDAQHNRSMKVREESSRREVTNKILPSKGELLPSDFNEWGIEDSIETDTQTRYPTKTILPPNLPQATLLSIAPNRWGAPFSTCTLARTEPNPVTQVQREGTSKAFEDCVLTSIPFLRRQLQSRKRIAVVSGAGISVSAGIPDFRSMRSSSKISFDVSVYNSPEATTNFHSLISRLSRLSSKAKPTPFHKFLDMLARDGRLLRHYTQNIDFIERQLAGLREKTVHLHGRIDRAVCQYCSWSGPLPTDRFVGPDAPLCQQCEVIALERVLRGKRRSGVGRIRPNVLLYGEENPNSTDIGKLTAQDLRKAPDLVIVVGTSLKVPGARRLAKELCCATKASGGTTAWINKEAAPSGLNIVFDFVIRAGCDDVISGL